MKKLLLKCAIFISASTMSISSSAASGWTQKANFTGQARDYGTGFSIGNYGFIGCGWNGSNFYNDMYKWNSTSNSWTSIASYPGTGYHWTPVGFSIEGKGYIGLGFTGSAGAKDLWRYDTGTNSWISRATFPGQGRYDATCFVIGHKAYIVGGSPGGPPYLNDVWVYDAHANTWTQLNNSPASATDGMVGFAIGNHGYIGGGGNGGGSDQNTFWEYDTTNDSWTPIASYPAAGGVGQDARAFVIGSTAYVCTGANGGTYVNPTTLPVGYAYDTISKGWTEFTNMGANKIERSYAVAFTIGNNGYIGVGIDSTATYLNSFWEYTPQSTAPQTCNVWTQKANFTGAARDYGTGFSIGNYGFIGCGWNGSTSFSDMYKWNSTSNSWSSIASYPGTGHEYTPIGFSIEGKGYIGLGFTGAGATDLWQYDTGANSWTSRATFPGQGRYDATWFVIGHKAYVIGGSPGGPPYLNDVWVYDAHANSWKQLNNSPASSTDGMVGFAIGNHGYIGGGGNGGGSDQNTFWEYDTTNDSWTPIASYPAAGGVGQDARAFVIGSTAYVCTGANGGSYVNPTTLSVGYAYDTTSKAWTEFTNMGANKIERSYAVAFTIGNYGYIGVGIDSTATYLNSFWQYYPCSDTLLTSVNQVVSVSNDVKIYPNPSKGLINVAYTGLNSENSEFMIIDMMGRVVETTTIKGKEGVQELNESSLSNGIYFYQLINSGKLVSNGKFIITK